MYRASHVLTKHKQECARLEQQLAEHPDDTDLFARLAREHSLCPSGKNGGDLGAFGPGQMVKAFEDEVSQLDVGGTSACFPTQFGYHVVRRTG